MRLSFAYPSSHHRTGGVTVLYEFANGLARRGHQVQFIHGPANPYRINSLDELPPVHFHPEIRHEIVDSLDDPALAAGDVVFHSEAPSRLGEPCIIVQGFRMLPFEWEREAFRIAAPKACVASWLVDIGRQFGVAPEQLWHVPPGLDHDVFRAETGIDERPVDVALLSHPHRNKGFDLALAAVEDLLRRRPSLRVLVFGMNDPARPLPTGVSYVAGLTHQQLADEVYNATKVFLQASRVEGFGYTPVEAMACGAAVVTTDNGGSRDYAIDEETALVVPQGDLPGLADAVERLLDDTELRQRLTAGGLAQVQRFDWDRGAALLEGHLEGYLQDPAALQAPPGSETSDLRRPVHLIHQRDPATGHVDPGEPVAPATVDRPARASAPQPRSEAEVNQRAAPSRCVFNVVWTGSVFRYLRFFVCSLMRHSDARFRFVTNGCDPDSVVEMEQFAERHPDRVVEVIDVSPDEMVAHGVALDRVLRIRDDGELFCLVDADIRASGPFVPFFTEFLDGCAAVTSGREVWNDDNVVPPGQPGVGGRHFFDADGFVFGSPHLGFYRRSALDETMQRWDVGFGSAGPELSPEATSAMADLGHRYRVYDTGKIVNVLLQVDGHRVHHTEHPDLMHIGGMSHYLASPKYVVRESGGEAEPDWVRYQGMEARYEVARFTARVLRALVDGEEPPPVPTDTPDGTQVKLVRVRQAVIDLVGDNPWC